MMLQKRSGSGKLGAPSYINNAVARLRVDHNDVAVSRYPANVSSAPVEVLILISKTHLVVRMGL
jgi:hypothetical protein